MQNHKKTGGSKSRGRVGIKGVSRVRDRDRVRVRGFNRIRDRDRASDEHVILFEKHPRPPSKKSGKNHPVRKN